MTDNKWQLSARACCTTLMASVAGGWVALVQSYFMNNKKQDVLTVVNGILGALVGVTGGCAVFNVYSSMVVGAVGSFLPTGHFDVQAVKELPTVRISGRVHILYSLLTPRALRGK